MEMLKTGVFWTFDVFWSLLLFFAHHKIIKTHYVLHILGHGIVSLSLLNYCLLTLTHIYQDVTKTCSEGPLRSERSERSTFVWLLVTYLSLTSYLRITYLLLTFLLTYYLIKTFAKLLQRCAHGASEASGVRSYYVLITYWLLIYYLACCLLDMCVILALPWRDVCMVVAWDSLATWFEFGGTVFEKLMFAYVFTSTYSYPNLSRCVQNCSNAPPPPTERMKRAEYVRLIYVLRTNHLLFTYLLLT
jgi:hypothetical protein